MGKYIAEHVNRVQFIDYGTMGFTQTIWFREQLTEKSKAHVYMDKVVRA